MKASDVVLDRRKRHIHRIASILSKLSKRDPISQRKEGQGGRKGWWMDKTGVGEEEKRDGQLQKNDTGA